MSAPVITIRLHFSAIAWQIQAQLTTHGSKIPDHSRLEISTFLQRNGLSPHFWRAFIHRWWKYRRYPSSNQPMGSKGHTKKMVLTRCERTSGPEKVQTTIFVSGFFRNMMQQPAPKSRIRPRKLLSFAQMAPRSAPKRKQQPKQNAARFPSPNDNT